VVSKRTVADRLPLVLVETDPAPNSRGELVLTRWLILNNRGEQCSGPLTHRTACREVAALISWLEEIEATYTPLTATP
jgi:hypothetical protein